MNSPGEFTDFCGCLGCHAYSSRKLGVQEDELKRANERAELAESKLKDVEQELETVGENCFPDGFWIFLYFSLLIFLKQF